MAMRHFLLRPLKPEKQKSVEKDSWFPSSLRKMKSSGPLTL